MPSLPTLERDPFLVVTLLAEVLLIAVTCPLWINESGFPSVPLFAVLANVPSIVDALLSIGLIASILTWIWKITTADSSNAPSAKRPSRLLSWIVLCLATALILLNQHRLQAWHWLFVILVAQTQIVHKDHKATVRRITMASIYIFAALSRIGPNIADGISVQMLSTICHPFGLTHLLKDNTLVFAAVSMMSVCEFSVGLGLLIKRTRRFAIIAAVLMHGTLIGILGPWGLNHHWGVVLWNAFFICAIPLLFRTGTMNEQVCSPMRRHPGTVIAVIFVLAFPLSGLFSVADNWPSWQLYSPRPEVVRLYVKSSAVARLPKDVQPFVGAPAPLQDWCPVQVHRWCLQTVQTPMYPEDRFQLGIILWLVRNVDSASVRVTIDSPGTPYWVHRNHTELNGTGQILERTGQHFLDGTAVRR